MISIVWLLALAGSTVQAGFKAERKFEGKGPHHEGLDWDNGPYKSLDEAPPVQYVRSNIPQANVPTVQGQSYDAVVPDTCDLAERARLFVDRYLTEITVPQLGHEPFSRGVYDVTPPRLTLDIGSYLCALPKYRESLPLMRSMCGSVKGLEIDRAWAENILKCTGPDGLNYVPLKHRPWDGAGGYDWTTEYPGATQHCSLPLGCGRLLGALAIYYRVTGDEVWKKTGQDVVDALNRLAIRQGGMATFDKTEWVYGETFTDEDRAQAMKEFFSQTVSESANNKSLWQTWIATGLSQFYKATGYEPARQLARELVNYLRHTEYVVGWKSHFHCITLGIHAMVELAEATGDMELARYAAEAYAVPRDPQRMLSIPAIGFFVNAKDPENPMEGCSIGDMTAIAVKLAGLLDDRYWEDVDGYARNILIEAQRTSPSQFRDYFRKLCAEESCPAVPVEYTHLADRLPQRLVGSFSLDFHPNDLFNNNILMNRGIFDPCCSGNCSRALYYVWYHMLQYQKNTGTLTAHLLLNRASAWADIDSYIPYTGRVDVKVKRPLRTLRLRMNDWIDKASVRCRVDETTTPFRWDSAYLLVDNLQPGETVRLDFPITERVEKAETFGKTYTITYKGNDVVNLEPAGKFVPLFQRQHYRSGTPRFRKVQRFVAVNPVLH